MKCTVLKKVVWEIEIDWGALVFGGGGREQKKVHNITIAVVMDDHINDQR